MDTIRIIIEEHRLLGFRQITKLAKSDLVKKYRGAALGWAWALVKPAVRIFVFWFAFSIGMKGGKPINGYPWILWLIAGFLPWFYMQEMISGGAGCIRKHKHLVTKMRFPVSTIPTFSSLSSLYIHWVLLAAAIIIFACTGHFPDKYYLQIPFYMLLMFVFFTVWALGGGLLAALSKDFQNLVKSIQTAIFWLSGVMYDVNKINNHTIRVILKFNPITVIASGYRKVFIYKEWFWEDKTELLCFSVTLLAFCILAIWAFRRLRKEVPDVL
ncbi:MAG: ABC transporter permease [Mogibacterium sp.]|nr:ABC transporter permease [Mogibacterium sp.]